MQHNVMELSPSLAPPSERTMRWMLAISAATIAALSTAFALDLVQAADTVTMAVAVTCGGVAAFGPHAWRSSWLGIIVALFASYGFAFALHDHAGRDAVVSAAGTVLALLLVRPLSRAHAAASLEGALDRFECVALSAGRSLFVVGILGLVTHEAITRAAGVATLGFALGLLGLVMWRDRKRMRFFTRVYTKMDPRYRVERDDEVSGFELLPPVLSGTITDAVIARVSPAPATYRTSDGPRPLARVMSSLPKMVSRVDKRVRMASSLVGVLMCCTSVVVVTPVEWSRAKSATPANASPVVAPACRDARPYFADRLEAEISDVGRATLLTQAQDPSIAADEGIILLVPRREQGINDETKSRALNLANGVPCSGKLSLVVEEPTYRGFAIAATLVLEPGADRAAVLRDADEQVRELFQPDARAVYNEHVDFGAVEKSFGYRVRHAIRHVLGVKSAHVTVNGGEGDVPLAPRDFPRLVSLTLR